MSVPVLLTTLQPFDNPVLNAMDLGGEVFVSQLGSAIADDEIAVGSAAERSAFRGKTDIRCT